jgi:predicted CoA-binding protein
MQDIDDAATAFLANARVAVTGVSRTPKDHGSNSVYKRLRERGYQVFAVNPNATQVEGDRAYPDLKSIPGGVDAVVIGTRPEYAPETVRECVELGVSTSGCTVASARAASLPRRRHSGASTVSPSSTGAVR